MIVGYRYRFDGSEALYPLYEFVEKPSDSRRLGVPRRRKRELGNEDVGRAETEVDLAETPERLQQQSGSDDEDDR